MGTPDSVQSAEASARGGMPDRSSGGPVWRAAVVPAVLLAVVLSIFSNAYGFERDELYFRLLRPAWGYVDQPPLVPLLARLMRNVADEPWAARIPATLAAVASVFVVVLICREAGGGRAAQTLCAWSYAFAGATLAFGHVLLTATLDLLFWPAICLCAMRAVRRDPRWWPAAGALVGVATFNKLLVALLVVGLLAGLAACGPRSVFRSPWFLGGYVLALLIAGPNLIYQASHGWPQWHMAQALSDNNASDVRVQMWPYLVLLLGPPLAPIWVAGLVRLARTPSLRFLAVAFAVVVLETFAGGGQLYYPVGILIAVFAVGCVPAAEFLARSRRWRLTAWTLIAVNGLVSALIGLPLVPADSVGNTPIPGINQTVADQIGWPQYVRQIAGVYAGLPDHRRTIVYASNYGEAGAIARYGPAAGLPAPYSGQNQLHFDAVPPPDTATVVAVGGQLDELRNWFAQCPVKARLDNGRDVDNEEQGEPVAVCTDPRADWATVWRALQHYD